MVAVNYLWNPLNDNIVREFDDAGAAVAEYSTEPDVYGNVISQRRDGESSFFHFEGLGSILALTNAAGAVSDTYAYTAFGEVTEHTGNTVNSFRYVGQKGYHRDEVTADYFVRARALNSDTARWTSVDPIGVANDANPYGGLARQARRTTNLYSYCSNNPAVAVDPSGLWEVRCRPLVHPFGPFHCWVSCKGKNYSLQNRGGVATPEINAPEDMGDAKILAKGDEDICDCLAKQFGANAATYMYDPHDCNSNYYAASMLICCGIKRDPKLAGEGAVYGWRSCTREPGKGRFTCAPKC